MKCRIFIDLSSKYIADGFFRWNYNISLFILTSIKNNFTHHMHINQDMHTWAAFSAQIW